uniref:WW domain-containing protein n=1 Tax=Ditylum brightwellii TaxID=49249 RepID=A0A7S2EB28_9STRA|mmetsp:Transcript_22006/g.32761  ORF Transcript_22006/g.32761 Transcript_22006/m.32761 type:complete len:729 (+) Transcript_22006:19-2205(+)
MSGCLQPGLKISNDSSTSKKFPVTRNKKSIQNLSVVEIGQTGDKNRIRPKRYPLKQILNLNTKQRKAATYKTAELPPQPPLPPTAQRSYAAGNPRRGIETNPIYSANDSRRLSHHQIEPKETRAATRFIATVNATKDINNNSNNNITLAESKTKSSHRTNSQGHNSNVSERSTTPPKINRTNNMPTTSQHIWKSAVDPKTGKTYYYDAVTRQTQWHKPIELASKSERAETARKEKKQRDFFAAMEANILKNMAQGVIPGTPQVKGCDEDEGVAPLKPSGKHISFQKAPLSKPKLVRTISAMDDTLLAELTKVDAFNDVDSPTSVADVAGQPIVASNKIEEDRAVDEAMKMSREMASCSSCDTSGESSAKKSARSSVSKSLPKPSLTKRNTCGTIYIGSTMSAPDKDATIKCVCGVYRAHMLQSVREETETIGQIRRRSSEVKFDEYEIFNDHPDDRSASLSSTGNNTPPRMHSLNKQGSIQGIQDGSVIFRTGSGIEALSLESAVESAVPSLDDITNFYRDVFRRSQMEADCIVMSLIYIERLIKDTNGGVRPRPSNWRSILFSCMVMSSKVWDDLSMWNADFSQTCPRGVSFSLQRINELELAVLGCLRYSVKVTASEYAKYYFLLRSMLIRSGLAGEDMTNTPLNAEGVQKLEHMSANFQINAETRAEVSRLSIARAKSVGVLEDSATSLSLGREKSFVLADTRAPSNDPGNSSNLRANLEDFVQL